MSLELQQRGLIGFFIALYLVCSVYLMIPFAIGCVGSGYTGLDSSPYGTPARPFAYRVLMPTIAKAVRSIIPEAVEKPATEWMIHWRDSDEGRDTVKSLFIRPPPLSNHKIFETAVVAAVCYVSLLAFLWIFYALGRALFPESIAYALVAPLIALELIPALTVENGYIYDFAELFFSCACFYMLYKRRWGAYLPCFALATLNKETSIFAVFFYMVWFYGRLPGRLYVRLLLLQLIIYGVIKLCLAVWFMHVPGSINSFNLMDNLADFREHKVLLMIQGVALIAAITYHWRYKPLFLLGGLWMLLPNIAAYLVAGAHGEYRAFYWSLPILLLLITHTLLEIAGIADLAIFKTDKNKV